MESEINPEKRIELELVLNEIRQGGYNAETKELFDKWLDQENALAKTGFDYSIINLKVVDVYLAIGDLKGALKALKEASGQVGQEMDKTRNPNSIYYSSEVEREIAFQRVRLLYDGVMEKIKNIEKMI